METNRSDNLRNTGGRSELCLDAKATIYSAEVDGILEALEGVTFRVAT